MTTLSIPGDRIQKYDPNFDADKDLKVKLPKKFKELDESGDGELDYKEFCIGFQFEATPLTRKLFEAFDSDGGGSIDIIEFIAGLRNWMNFSYDDKIRFTYKIYDLDGSGYLEPHELAECLADSNQGWRDQGAMQQIVRKVLKYLSQADLQRIKLSDFVTLTKKFPSALFLPLFGLMEKIFTIVEIQDK